MERETLLKKLLKLNEKQKALVFERLEHLTGFELNFTNPNITRENVTHNFFIHFFHSF
jgi:hypothetical protein